MLDLTLRPRWCGPPTHQPPAWVLSVVAVLGSERRHREDNLCSSNVMGAACVCEGALQQGHHMCAATRMTRVAKMRVMAGTSSARNRRDGRRRRMRDKSPDKLHSEGHGVKTTGSAHTHRGVVCWFGGWMYPTHNVVRSGGASPVMDMLTGLNVASGAERWPW